MTIKIEMLRTFCSVAETGSLKESAKRLNRSVSAVSMMLKQFESHAAVTLFEGERKNKLTAAGEQIFEVSQRQIRQFDACLQNITNIANAPQGILRMACIPSVASTIYASVVSQSLQHFPRLRIDIRDMDSASIVDLLSQGLLDIGIASGNMVINDTRQQTLFSDAFGLVIAKQSKLFDEPLSSRSSIELEEIPIKNLFNNNLAQNLDNHRVQQLLQSTTFHVHNTLTLVSMLASGDWVSILPRNIISVAPTSLQFIPINNLTEKRLTTLYIKESSIQFPYVKKTCEVINELLATQTTP